MHIVVCDDDKGCCTKIEKWVKEYKNYRKCRYNSGRFL